MKPVSHIGYRFYTDRVDPRDWVYEDYFAEVDALGKASVAQGGHDYVRESREQFAEARARRIWGVPEPKQDFSEARRILSKLKLDLTRRELLNVLFARSVALQNPDALLDQRDP